MEHEIYIYRENKNNNSFSIVRKYKITESDIEKLAMSMYEDEYPTSNEPPNYKFSASIEETKI